MNYPFYLNTPLEQFEVTSLIEIKAPILGTFVLSLTNLGLYSILTILLVISYHYFTNNNYSLVPSQWSVSTESAYITISNIVRDQVGNRHEIYTPFIVGIFWFILIANLNGNIPYGYTITTSAVTAIGLSVTVFLGVTILGFYLHRLHFFSYFVPENTPIFLVFILVLIELISYLARAISLGVRLFANIVAGHTLLKILATFLGQLFSTSFFIAILTLIPFSIFVALIGLELAVSLIQSYVFVVLTCSYIKDAIELH